MTIYRVAISGMSETEFIVRENSDGSESWIPKDESNSDYQRYLRWLENPNEEEGGAL